MLFFATAGPGCPQAAPPSQQPIYQRLQVVLSSLERYLDAHASHAGDPPVYGAELLTANCNRGPDLLKPSTMAGVKVQLDAFQRIGIQGVTVPIHAPLLDPSFPHASEYLAFYEQVATEVRQRGMKLDVECHVVFANTPFSPIQYDYQSLGFDRYLQMRRYHVELVLSRIKPDYLDVAAEPDTEVRLTGRRELTDPQVYGRTIGDLVHGLHKGRTAVGAGIGSWGDIRFVEQFVRIGDLDFIALHVYPLTRKTIQVAARVCQLARQHGKRVVLDEMWLYKMGSGDTDSMAGNTRVFARDAYRFWEPLDAQFLRTMVKFARAEGVAYVSPFWTQFLFGYIDYDEETDRLPYRELTQRVNRAASDAMSKGRTSAVGQEYQRLIQGGN